MAETTFRAVFEAEDRSFSAMMRQMRVDSAQMASDMIDDANKVAAATDQGVNKVLQEQIALYERGRDVAKREERLQLDNRYSSQLSTATNPHAREAITKEWKEESRALTDAHKQDDLQVRLLREVVLSIKDAAAKELASDRETASETIRAVFDGNTNGLTPEQEFKARVQAGMVGRDEKEDKPDNIISDVAIGTMIGQSLSSFLSKVGSIGAGMMSGSDSEQMLSKAWGLLPDYLGGGMLSAASARNTELSETSDRLVMGLRARGVDINPTANSTKTIASFTPIVSRQEKDKTWQEKLDESEVGKAVNKGFDYVRNLFKQPTQEELDKKEQYDRHKSIYGKKSADQKFSPVSAVEGSQWDYMDAGVDSIEFAKLAGKVLQNTGNSRKLAGDTRSLIDITQGGGISEGAALGLADLLRLGGGGDLRTMMGSIVGNLDANGSNRAIRDSQVSDVMSMASGRYSAGMANVDVNRLANVKGSFYNNYGAALSSSDNIQSMMSSVASPSDDNQQAINYKIYAAQRAREGKPVSYTDFMKWQEDPTQGLLGGKMDYINGVYGDGEYGEMAFKAAGIGKTWSASSAYLKGGSKGLSSDELGKMADPVEFDAKAYTTDRQTKQAEITDAFIAGMSEGMTKVFDQIGDSIAAKISGSGIPFASDLAKWIREMAKDPHN